MGLFNVLNGMQNGPRGYRGGMSPITMAVLRLAMPGTSLGLITVAELLPPDWDVCLVDRNAGDLTDRDIDSADLVITGSMLPQRPDTLKVIPRVQARGKPVVVGGPDASPALTVLCWRHLKASTLSADVVSAKCRYVG